MEYNHNRKIEDFKEQIEIIKKEGFNIIAVSQLLLEDTFVFTTNEEAKKAYETLERNSDMVWIGKKEHILVLPFGGIGDIGLC